MVIGQHPHAKPPSTWHEYVRRYKAWRHKRKRAAWRPRYTPTITPTTSPPLETQLSAGQRALNTMREMLNYNVNHARRTLGGLIKFEPVFPKPPKPIVSSIETPRETRRDRRKQQQRQQATRKEEAKKERQRRQRRRGRDRSDWRGWGAQDRPF